MKVKELKKLLEKFDDELHVLGADHDGYYYDFDIAKIVKVKDGVEVKNGETVVGLS
jgi:hypothetical protein